MRILVLSDYYPPAYVGGYEIMCKIVVDGLRKRGHDVQVLTARRQPYSTESHVHQILTPCDSSSNPVNQRSLIHRAVIERRESTLVQRMIEHFQPDLCYIWNGRGLLRTVIAIACQARPTVMRLGDYWARDFINLKMDRWHGGWAGIGSSPAKKRIGRFARALRSPGSRLWKLDLSTPPLQNAIFVSRWAQSTYAQTFPAARHGVVIYNCVPQDIGPPDRPRPFLDRGLRLLFAGRIHPQKGLHSLIEGFARAVDQVPDALAPTLTIAGAIGDTKYAADLRVQAASLGVERRVTFPGQVQRSAMRELYLSHDALCYPSIWPEPFGNSITEALSMGMPVIATRSGGIPEIIDDQDNGLLVSRENPDELASAMTRLTLDPNLYEKVSRRGIETVVERFSFQRMMDDVESHLLKVMKQQRFAQMSAW